MRYTTPKYLYNQIPLQYSGNRDENIIIDLCGCWVPEFDVIYFGLLNSPFADDFPKIRDQVMYKSDQLYREFAFLSSKDLIQYLASETEEPKVLEAEVITKITHMAISHYVYAPWHETMLRHTIMTLAMESFVKSVTLVFPWPIREYDIAQEKQIIPPEIFDKFKFYYGDMTECITEQAKNMNEDDDTYYTTIISDSIDEVAYLIDHAEELHTKSSFYLLRNCSENMRIEQVEDPDNPGEMMDQYIEVGTLEILEKIADVKLFIPKNRERFARYEPFLYEDLKPRDDPYQQEIVGY